MSSGKKDLTSKTVFEPEMEHVDKPVTDVVTSTCSTEDIPEVSIDTHKKPEPGKGKSKHVHTSKPLTAVG